METAVPPPPASHLAPGERAAVRFNLFIVSGKGVRTIR